MLATFIARFSSRAAGLRIISWTLTLLVVFVARVSDVGGYLARRHHSLFVCLCSLSTIKNIREIIIPKLILYALWVVWFIVVRFKLLRL